jgi:geranylgeranyl pyrophosphate synthase
MQAYYEKAVTALNAIGIDQNQKIPLQQLAQYLMKREN